ncbi:MAG TPA: carboxypeptidase regulatory-like domain-containing protein [Firmicutes bacterium]|nr:carboxypeptidase regulatory-like domain-containing protein [Bacillota bacterium]
MLSGIWWRLCRVGIIILLIYLTAAYACLITIIIRKEVRILDAAKVISALSTGNKVDPALGVLEAQVRSVFGDPIPHAVILLADRLVQADNTGNFRIINIKPGTYTLEILAGDYEKYAREIKIEAGVNSPPIKYDLGLWPQDFLVDFHIFYKDAGEVLGIAGFANGAEEPIFIERATILDPSGKVITDILHDNDGFAYYADLSSRLEIVNEPQKALKWPPRMWQSGEFAPLAGNFPPGPYSLEVHYAFATGHKLGQYRVLVITDHLDWDSNWNPHLP